MRPDVPLDALEDEVLEGTGEPTGPGGGVDAVGMVGTTGSGGAV